VRRAFFDARCTSAVAPPAFRATIRPLAGWIVLGRAYEKLLVLEQGWTAAQAAGDPIDD
jgi:hypothetical protein